MYVIRETEADGTNHRVVKLTDDIDAVVAHCRQGGWVFVFDVAGTKVFTHPDGRTASVAVEPAGFGIGMAQ